VSRDVTFEEEVAFIRSRGSHMEIYSKKHKDMVPSPPHPSKIHRETIEPIDPTNLINPVAPVDVPINIVLGQKNHAWDIQTL
jgi:hypothetical protein